MTYLELLFESKAILVLTQRFLKLKSKLNATCQQTLKHLCRATLTLDSISKSYPKNYANMQRLGSHVCLATQLTLKYFI